MLPVDAEGRVLLLHGWDPHHPDHPFWFTIGTPRSSESPSRRTRSSSPAGSHRIVQDQTFYAVLVTSAEVSLDGLDLWERATTEKTAGSPPATWAPTILPRIPTSPT